MGTKKQEQPPGPEWEVVRFYSTGLGLGGEEHLMVLLTPVGDGFRMGLNQWATWKTLPRLKFGDHIVGTRLRIE